MNSTVDVTQLLRAYTEGDPDALDRLIPQVYNHLRQLAHARLLQERPDHTLNTTGLVHEAYLKLIDVNRISYESRGHFFAMASRVMRRVLVDYARRRKAQKRGGGVPEDVLDEAHLLVPERYAETLLGLNDALERLAVEHPREGQVVEQRYFGGLMNYEIAEALGVSVSTVERDLRFARAWLAHALGRAANV